LPGLDDEADDVVQAGQSGEEIKGSQAGTLIHGVLERIREWMNSDGEINDMVLNECIESLSKETERPLSEAIKKRIKTECTAICRTRLVRRLSENVLSGEHEYSMNLPVDDFFMNGIIDVLITNENGELEVWDWKTNVIDSEIDMARHIENYELQMKIYAFFVLLMQPKQKEIKCRLLFTRLAVDNAEDEDWTHVYKWSRQEVNEFAGEIKTLVARTHINV
jgi:ATP-dependent exoDNAse (exonuclease V) beta subunit